MNIKFIRNIFLSTVVCLLLVSCEGKDCIEPDDFGEYDTDLITIESKNPNCGLVSSNISASSPKVAECVETQHSVIEFEGSYKIKSSQKDKTISCYELYFCYSEGDSNCYDDYKVYKVTNGSEEEVTDYQKQAQFLLQTAYNSCSETCINNCLLDIDMDTAFETNWVPNNKKNKKSGNGIKLPLGQTVNIQVVGKVKLTETSQQNLEFKIGEKQDSSYKIFENGKYFRDSLGPVLFGGWCFGAEANTSKTCSGGSNSNIRWIGEIDDSYESLQDRYEFLRRGVVILTRIPKDGKIDDNNEYTGPVLFPDYDKWGCTYDTKNLTVKCETNYDSGQYKEQNDTNFAMDNDFVKVNGGLVVPEKVSKLVLNEPNKDVDIDETGKITITNTSSNTYKFKGKTDIKSLYPVKLAFIVPHLNIESCQIIVNNNAYKANINNKDNWFFASDTNGSHVIFNKNAYNTLKLDKTSDMMDWDKDNMFDIVINAENCQKDGDYIPVYVFAMPQNEILINKSGFISFKTLLGNFGGENINFDIINPMYTNKDHLSDNFYEYIDKNKAPIIKTAILDTNKWSNEIFVRKGQILRFNSDNWFDIKGDQKNGYNITKKAEDVTIDEKPAHIGIGDSLVLKIEYRPALLCNGTSTEKIDNPNCSKKYHDNGKVTCSDTRFSNFCVAYKPENNQKCEDKISWPNSSTGMCYDRYCPMGCYCTNENCEKIEYIAGAADFKAGCMFDANANSYSCGNCVNQLKNYTGEEQQTPENELELIQCYDLENYQGAVRNLLDGNKLSDTAKTLGAKNLASIFEGGDYGNLDGMVVDTLYKNFSDLKFSKFRYNSPFVTGYLNSKINSANKYLSFLIINNKDLEFSSNVASAGEYNLIFNPEKTFSNGEQLAIALVNDKDDKGYWGGDENDGNFMGWIVKYNMNKKATEGNYGTISTDSPNLFDDNGHIDNLKINILINGNETDVDTSNLKLFFKIVDKLEESGCNNDKTKVPYEKVLCKCASGKNSQEQDYQSCDTLTCDIKDGKPVDVITKTESICVNSYYNNDGSYTIKLKTPKDTTDATSYIVKYVMKPVLEILDGKNVGLYVDNNKKLEDCSSESKDDCAFYFPESKFSEYEKRFGEGCTKSDNKEGEETICYRTCAGLDDSLYSSHCKYFNNGGGFLQRFYIAVITDNYYQTIVKLCFTLMIMFYGMYYLMGMAELTHGELVKRLFKISFIYLMIGTKGWEYYNMFFVKFFKQGVDYLVFAVASAFDDNKSLMGAFIKGDFYDKSVLFSGVDKNLSLLFSDAVSYKIWGLFFVSFFGWLYVFIIYSSILTYIFSVANAMLLYVTAQFFLSLLLAMGPIFLVMLIFDKTKDMFNKWISNLISFGLEQIFLLTCLSLFNILVYNIIKYVLSFRVCWKSVWEINIPLLGSLQMMSFWKATTSTSATAAATAVPGLFQILLIYLIADLMDKFIELSAQLGGNIGGSGMYLNFLAEGIKKDAKSFYDSNIKSKVTEQAQKMGTDFLKKTIGYKTAKDEEQQAKNSKNVRKYFRDANSKADAEVAKYKEKNKAELMELSPDKRRERIANVRNEAFVNALKQNGGVGLLKEMGIIGKDATDKDIAKTALKLKDKDLQDSQSLLGWFGKHSNIKTALNPHNWGSSGAFTSSEEKARQIRSGESKMGDFDSKTVKQHKAQSEIQQQPSVSGRNTPSATSSSPSSLGSSGRRTPSSYPPPPPPSGSGSHTSSITPSSPLYEDEDTGTSHHEVGDKADESHPGDVGGSDKHAPSGGEGYGSEPGYVGGSDKGHESEPDDDGEPYSESELDELDDEGDEDAPSDGEGHGSKAGDVDGDDEDVPSSGEGHESESDDEDDSGDSSDGSEEYSDDNPPPLPPR